MSRSRRRANRSDCLKQDFYGGAREIDDSSSWLAGMDSCAHSGLAFSPLTNPGHAVRTLWWSGGPTFYGAVPARVSPGWIGGSCREMGRQNGADLWLVDSGTTGLREPHSAQLDRDQRRRCSYRRRMPTRIRRKPMDLLVHCRRNAQAEVCEHDPSRMRGSRRQSRTLRVRLWKYSARIQICRRRVVFTTLPTSSEWSERLSPR